MRNRVKDIVAELLAFQPETDPVQSLKQFLRKDEHLLGVLLALTNLSQEKFLQIITAQRFANQDFAPEWGMKEILPPNQKRRLVCKAHRTSLP